MCEYMLITVAVTLLLVLQTVQWSCEMTSGFLLNSLNFTSDYTNDILDILLWIGRLEANTQRPNAVKHDELSRILHDDSSVFIIQLKSL